MGIVSGYDDLCRIYMIEQAIGWYAHIMDATNELRAELKTMIDMNRSPKDFGLCVRNHPDSLIVTARNKMRTAETVTREIDIAGRLIETSRLFTDPKIVKSNLGLMANMYRKLNQLGSPEKFNRSANLLWREIDYTIIHEFIDSFQNHPESSITDSQSVKGYIKKLADEEDVKKWNVLFVSIKESSPERISIDIINPELTGIGPGMRRSVKSVPSGIMLFRRKLNVGDILKIDLPTDGVRANPAFDTAYFRTVESIKKGKKKLLRFSLMEQLHMVLHFLEKKTVKELRSLQHIR